MGAPTYRYGQASATSVLHCRSFVKRSHTNPKVRNASQLHSELITKVPKIAANNIKLEALQQLEAWWHGMMHLL